jgi:hypothetical protein
MDFGHQQRLPSYTDHGRIGKKGRFIAKDRIDQAMTPEIVVALCGPLGTPLHRVSEILKDLLSRSPDYKRVEEIRLSELHTASWQAQRPQGLRA